MAHKIRCHIVGTSSLCLQCAKILQSRGHSICSMISSHGEVVAWARKEGVPCYPDLQSAEAVLAEDTYDYLFSIVNPCFLKPLQHPHQKMINFHDGPLPRYAGMNATTWAILNDEKQYGVTWHEIAPKIDAGNVLKQPIFPVLPTETTFSLNLKCYEHALVSFAELISDIERGCCVSTPQDLSQRLFYKASAKPARNGLIRWDEPGESIERLFRATDCGNYASPFASTKLIVEGEFYFPTQLALMHLPSNKAPGTIVLLNDQCIQVATTTQIVSITQLKNKHNQVVSMTEFQKKHGLCEGMQLDSPDETACDLFQQYAQEMHQYESYWVKQLEHLAEAPSPFKVSPQGIPRSTRSLKWVSTLSWPKTSTVSLEMLMGLIMIYLYRINNFKPCGVQYYPLGLQDRSSLPASAFAQGLPFSVDLAPEMTAEAALESIQFQLAQTLQHGTYAEDVMIRYPHLNEASLQGVLAVVPNESTHEILFYADENLDEPSLELIRNMPGHLMKLWESIIAAPHHALYRHPILTEEERLLVLQKWNQTTQPYVLDRPIHAYFEEQAKRIPSGIALDFEGQTLTYAELNQRANQLAHCLIAHLQGLQFSHPHNPMIALFLPRSLELVIAIVAVLKAGAAYVPIALDTPFLPFKRIIETTETPLILTVKDLYLHADMLKKVAVPCWCLDENAHIKSESKETNPDMPQHPSDLAYVIHTSGSTGEPKGVLSLHRGLCNRLMWMQDTFHLKEQDVVLQKTPYTFDVSVWEFLWPLRVGAKLIIAKPEGHRDVDYLIDLIRRKKVTTLHFVPSMLEAFLEHPESVACTSLSQLICSGEALPYDLKNRCLAHFPQAELFNLYGPTEASIDVSYWNCKETCCPGILPIGRPIANMQLYVLDRYLNLMPIGCEGELYIAGVGLALGYLNQDEKTKAHFIDHRLTPNKSIKLYKTGDLARWLPQGALDFIGRNDEQVKIKGLRIECGAIANVLKQHPDVLQCVVVPQDIHLGKKQLVAYCVPAQEGGLNSRELQQHLAEFLPDYMIPHYFVALEELPLSPNGKLNKNALPVPVSMHPTQSAKYAPARTLLEKQFVEIWEAILQVTPIGIHDDFFSLGGDSLSASEILVEIQKRLGLKIPLDLFFDGANIAALTAPPSKSQKENLALLLPHEIRLSPAASFKPPKHIFLTGATGFVGAHLLADLCRLTSSTLYCLVRAETQKEAIERLRLAADAYKLSFDPHRIVPVCGDVALPQLGIANAEYEMLCKTVDCIIHSAAWVNHLYSFKKLKSVNTDSIIELLKLAVTDQAKPLHYISTLSVATDYDENGLLMECFPSEKSDVSRLTTGYAKSKWAAEYLLMQASRRGIRCPIYRLPWVTGHSRTGLFPAQNDHQCCLIKTCIELPCAPDWPTTMNFLPIDCVSEAFVKIFLNTAEQNHSEVYHLVNAKGLTWRELIHFLNQQGYPIEIVPIKTWHAQLMSRGKTLPLAPFLALYRNLSALEQLPTQTENDRVVRIKAAQSFSLHSLPKDLRRFYFTGLSDKLV